MQSLSLFDEPDTFDPAIVTYNDGAVYTPVALAEWAADLLAEYTPDSTRMNVLDPACGDGALLKAVSIKYRSNASLVGIDINASSLSSASQNLTDLSAYNQNALMLMSNANRASILGDCKFDAIIMNPPWGANPRISSAHLRAIGYTLARGQFDTYDLFIELALNLLEDKGVLVAIIPDSLFLPEHEALRRLLVCKTQICLLARLGEGFFDGVFRGTTVLVALKQSPQLEHKVCCLRLTKEWRRRILAGKATLSEASDTLMHSIPQHQFAQNDSVRFAIDTQADEQHIINRIAGYECSWSDWFVSGRGVELSKTGRAVLCPHCNHISPVPRSKKQGFCSKCARQLLDSSSNQVCLVRPCAPVCDTLWHPLIVGEDVDRYYCAAKREIRLGAQGINYKTHDTFKQRKLLVRKTGLGIKAAIDDTGAYTNQVVFHYIQKDSSPEFAMDYVLGVLNSRVLLAFHLKSLGETEWRSHPYITQKIIASLPIPKVAEGTWQWRQAAAIARAVHDQSNRRHLDNSKDLYIEQLCAGLFGLQLADCEWVLNVLNQTEGLEPLRTLRLADASQIQPIRVA